MLILTRWVHFGMVELMTGVLCGIYLCTKLGVIAGATTKQPCGILMCEQLCVRYGCGLCVFATSGMSCSMTAENTKAPIRRLRSRNYMQKKDPSGFHRTCTVSEVEVRCGFPPKMSNAIFDYNEDTLGASVTYVCDEDCLACGDETATSVCEVTGLWSPTISCERYKWSKPSDFNHDVFWPIATIPSCVKMGNFSVLIRGKATNGSRFCMGILGGNERLVHFEGRFQRYTHIKKVIASDCINSEWGPQLITDRFPFTYNKTFNMIIFIGGGNYTVHVDGKYLLTFTGRTTAIKPDKIAFEHGFSTESVEVLV